MGRKRRRLGRPGAEPMDALATYVGMGGYAAFVWPAYAITAAVLGGLTIQSWRRYRASRDALARLGNRQ
ncbi:MAG: heme exporter protein CcmD [Alphaproteobacteria bacterium]|nr:heme exporter protein CcmD [Alphaproteobacteria bacterium]